MICIWHHVPWQPCFYYCYNLTKHTKYLLETKPNVFYSALFPYPQSLNTFLRFSFLVSGLPPYSDFSFFDCVTFPSVYLGWLKSLSFAIVMFSQADVLMPSIKQIIQNLDINYLMLLYITNLANPLPELYRLAYSWTSCIYKVISISLPLFLATNCIRFSFKQISTCHSIFTCKTETSLPNYSVLNWPPHAWAPKKKNLSL